MKKIAVALGAVLLLAPCTGLAAGTAVNCRVTVDIGFPAGAGSHEGSVFLAPGSVIALASPAATPTPEQQSAAVADSLARSQLWEQLVTTFRLDGSRHRTTTTAVRLLPGKETKLSPDPNLSIHVRLDGSTAHAAAFRVLFKSGGSVLADTPVSVALGSRAVVGATDGDEAPYVFVTLEPLAPEGPRPVRFTADSGMTEPKVIKKVAPEYPEDARSDKVTGEVVLEVVIKKDGTVDAVTPLRSPDQRLTEAAANAVREWIFEPTRDSNGKAVVVYYVLTVRFVLH